MTPIEFAYWLQGFFELSEAESLSEKQVKVIKNHLGLVFHHVIDPSYTSHLSDEEAKKVQSEKTEIHSGNAHPGSITYRC